MRNSPSLNALRVFEAAARHENLTKAGAELGITQSAVSKHVGHLEEALGQPLFVRRNRRVVLTDFGREVAAAVGGALSHLTDRLNAIRIDRPNQIAFTADADFIQLWLFPRFFAFEKAHAQIRISLTAGIATDAPPEEDYDCAVIWGRGNWQGCRFELLFPNTVFPVAAPDFFDRLGRPPSLADLTPEMLIHDRSSYWWSAFRAAAGIATFDPDAGRVYNQTSLCLEAAAQGMGVTIGDEVTTRPYLESGRLVCPFPERLPSPFAYYVVTPINAAVNESVTAFVDWLREEADAHRSWYDRFWARQAAAIRDRSHR